MRPPAAPQPTTVRRIALVAGVCLCLVASRGSAHSAAVADRSDDIAVPLWAFPNGPDSPLTDSLTPRHMPHSSATYTAAEAQNFFAVLDWHPELHPPMPAIVAHGRKRAVYACAYCHLADGIGRPENAMLAGLPTAYIAAQIADIRSGARRSAWAPYGPGLSMLRVADSATADDIAAAARYFTALRAHPRSRVIEATRIPRAIAGKGVYFRDPRGGEEELGDRLIEMASDREAHELHDPLAEYVAYVPPGSIARGRALATTGRGGAPPACASCHGPELRGVGLVPPLAGRAPSYLLRQLIAFRTGTRSSPAGAPMRAVAASLDVDDMIAAAAYAATLRP